MKLYTYFRSTASYRVRLALAYKRIAFTPHFVNLRTGEQNQQYRQVNRFGLVPALSTEQGVISQSLAILEYIEKLHPSPALWLSDPWQQAQAMSIAQSICCDIHPLNNLKVLQYLTGTLKVDETQKTAWYHHWVHEGFKPLEASLKQLSGTFCVKETLSVADICLIPQVYNAKRFEVDLTTYPTIQRINQNVLELDWVNAAIPEMQGDFTPQ